MKADTKGVRGFFKSFGFAWAGLKLLFFKERNFTIQFFWGIAVLVLGFLFQISALEWVLVIISIISVLAMEIINTALETLADAITEEEHPKIKKAKDLSAGAVLITAIGAAAIGTMIFLPKFIEFIRELL